MLSFRIATRPSTHQAAGVAYSRDQKTKLQIKEG